VERQADRSESWAGFPARASADQAIGMWLADRVVTGVPHPLVTARCGGAVLLGVGKAVVRPIVFILTETLTILTLGLSPEWY